MLFFVIVVISTILAVKQELKLLPKTQPHMALVHLCLTHPSDIFFKDIHVAIVYTVDIHLLSCVKINISLY